MRKRPGMSFLVIIALVLGIGVNTAVFSVVNAVILRPLPVFEPDRIVKLYAKGSRVSQAISYPEYLDWKAQSNSFQAIAIYSSVDFNLTGNATPEHLKGFAVSSSCPKVFGVSTVLGRDFTEQDDQAGAPRVVMLNERFWHRHFGGDSTVLGSILVLDDQPYTVIGVLKDTQLSILQQADVWVPNGPFIDQLMMSRESRFYWLAARLKPSVSQTQATKESETIAARLAAQYPASNKDVGIRLVNLTDVVAGAGRRPLVFLLLASSLVFFLACINVLVVFLNSAVDRRKELSIRLALGTPRATLLRQFFTHALVLAGISSVLAFAMAKLGLAFFVRRFPSAVGRFQETSIDNRDLFFLIGMAFIVSVLSSVLPALYASRLNINRALKDETNWSVFSRYRSLGQSALIIFEVSLACALAVVSGLLIKSFYQVTNVDLGFNTHHVLSFQINLPSSRYTTDPQKAAFHKLALAKLLALPGVQSISGLSSLPLTTQGSLIGLQVDADPPPDGERSMVEYESILPGLVHTIQLPLLEGRDFTDADSTNTPRVVIVDELLAARFWPGKSPIGKRLRLPEPSDPNPPWREIVGVVRQIKHFGPESQPKWMQVYLPQYQDPTPVLSFVMDTNMPAATVKVAAESAIHQLDKDLPLDNFRAMDDLLDSYTASRKVSLLLLSAFAAIGITLGAIGIYGVVSNSVTRRRREIAIRMALGAACWHTIFLVTRAAGISALAGIISASTIIVVLRRVLAAFLFGISPLDVSVYLLTIVVTVVITLLAILVPATALLRFNLQEILRE